jgi:hypothetical protein
MSQSLLIKPKSTPTKQIQQTLFSLNMHNVDAFFPGFASGDFAVIYGGPAVLSLTSLLCIRAQLPTKLGGLSSKAIFIDCGNTFNRHQISRLSKLNHIDPQQALDRIALFPTSTAYQLTTLIMERLQDVVKKTNAKLIILSNIAEPFLDKDIPEEDSRRVFSQVAAYLQSFAHQNQIILIATYPPRQNSSRNSYLKMVTCEKANVVLSITQTMYDREFTLEKHPRFMLGCAEFPSENLTLTDFMHR